MAALVYLVDKYVLNNNLKYIFASLGRWTLKFMSVIGVRTDYNIYIFIFMVGDPTQNNFIKINL